MLHEKLKCYHKAVEVAEELSKEGAKWPKGYSYLIDQHRRAMASVILNLAEGNARTSAAERRRFFEISRAVAAKVAACIDIARSFGLLKPLLAYSLNSHLHEISKMIWALMRR